MKGVMDRHSFVPHVRGAVVQDSDVSDGKWEKAMAVDYFFMKYVIVICWCCI